MSVAGALQTIAKSFLLTATSDSDEVLFYRASGPEQVDTAYLTSSVTIAGATDTVRLEVGKKAGGTGSFTQIADFPAATAKTADTPVTGTMTATVASTKLVSGDWLAFKPTLAGTGVITRIYLVLNFIMGHKN